MTPSTATRKQQVGVNLSLCFTGKALLAKRCDLCLAATKECLLVLSGLPCQFLGIQESHFTGL